MAGQTFAWATLMAMGVVTAFGAIENAISRPPPQAATRPTPLSADRKEPAMTAKPSHA